MKTTNMLLLVKSLKKRTEKAKNLGAESLDYSTHKNNKYVATLPIGKKIHFGSAQYPDQAQYPGNIQRAKREISRSS